MSRKIQANRARAGRNKKGNSLNCVILPSRRKQIARFRLSPFGPFRPVLLVLWTGLWLGVRLEEIPNDVIRRHASRGIEPWVIGNLVRNIHWRVVPVVLPSHQAEQLHLRAAATGCGILLYDSADIALRVTKRHSSVKAGTIVWLPQRSSN